MVKQCAYVPTIIFFKNLSICMQNDINIGMTENHQNLEKDKCVFHMILFFFFSPVVCIHFYFRKVETSAEFILWSTAP